MNIVYLASMDRVKDVGIYNKIMAQMKSFKNQGFSSKFELVPRSFGKIFSGQFTYIVYNWKSIKIKDNVDVLYIRYPMASMGFLKFLKDFKRKRKGRKIIIEVPSYPYEYEKKKTEFLIAVQDLFCRPMLHHYVDRIATFSTHKWLFKIPAIHIRNGVDFDSIKNKRISSAIGNEIHMIGVANMKFWQAYDRVIKGLADYYDTKTNQQIVKIHLVGAGTEIPYYRELVKKHNLENYVLIHGKKEGEELDDIYSYCDIGILPLGIHRKGGYSPSSALKSREYSAKGLLMIGSWAMDVFPENKYPYVRYFSNDEKNIEISKVVLFYNQIFDNKNKDEIFEKIRKISKKRCDINIAMKPVIRYLKEIDKSR